MYMYMYYMCIYIYRYIYIGLVLAAHGVQPRVRRGQLLRVPLLVSLVLLLV